MKLGIDLSPFFTESKYRGIGRYARGLLEELIRIDQESEYHFLNLYGDYIGDPALNAHCYLHRYDCGPMINDNGEKLLLSGDSLEEYLHAVTNHFLQSSKIDAMLFLSMQQNDRPFKAEWFSGVFKIGILYDLIPLIFSQEYISNEDVRSRYLDSLEFVKKMDLLLAISETTKQDAVRLLGISPEKIVVINAGLDPQFLAVANKSQATLAERISRKNPYILFVGGIDPRKNIERAIQAYAMNRAAREHNIRFYIAGLLPDLVKEHLKSIVKEHSAEERVVFCGHVSDEEVIELYQNAVALLFPSLYEGFGLPAVEAMCCGTVVITSNSTSLREVANGWAYLVEPEQVESISGGITRVLENRTETEELIRAAREYAQTYRWARVAQDAHRAMQACLQGLKPSEKPNASFQVNSGLLARIVQRYAEWQVPFRWPDAMSFAKELYRLENALPSPGNRHGTRILFDVTVVCIWMNAGYETGIARVSNQLRHALMSYAEVVPVTLKTVRGKTVAIQVDMNTRSEGTALEFRTGDIYLMPELQIREVQVSRDYPSAQSLRIFGIQTYAVVYDILPLLIPEYFEKKTIGKFEGYLEDVFKNYDGILTDSKVVADDIWHYQRTHHTENARVKRVKIGYFHLGMDSFKSDGRSVNFSTKVMFRGSELIFLMVGTIEPRKGHTIVLDAFERLWKMGVDCKLCIIGRTGWMMEPFVQRMKQHKEYGRKLLLLEGANDFILEYAYQHSSALIQASAGEGFGLPIIEAACNRLPVLCSDIPVFHEVAGDHALYFSRYAESLVQCILDFQRAKREGNPPDASRIELRTWDDAARRVFSMLAQDVDWSYRAQ